MPLTVAEIRNIAEVLTRLESENPSVVTDADGKRWIIVRADMLPEAESQ